MTIATTINKIIAQGNAVTTVFNYGFYVDLASHIVATYTDAGGNQSDVSLTVQPTVTGVGNPLGGTFSYTPGGNPMPVGSTLTFQRIVPYEQDATINNQGNFYPAVVEAALDFIVLQTQQLAEQVGRAIVASPTDSNYNMVLPTTAQRANKALLFDSNGNPTVGAVNVAVYGVRRYSAAAAAGQTVFNVGFIFVAGVNATSVFVNGIRMEPGADFIESSTSQITMLYPLALNDKVVVYGGQELTGVGAVDASTVSYSEAGTAVATDVQSELRKFSVVDTIALLKAKALPNNNVAVLVKGFAAAGDGGGGLYYWNAADVTADNGGTIIQLNAGGNGRFNKLF